MKIKICGIKDKTNLAEVIAAGPDLIGLIFYRGSARYMGETLSPADVRSERIKKVGVFVNQTQEEVQKAIDDYSLDAIQLHGNESPVFCLHFMSSGVTVIKAFSVSNTFDFSYTAQYISCCNYFLFDTKGEKEGGNGIPFDWLLLKNYRYEVPFFLSGGIGPRNIQQALQLRDMNMAGIDLNSKLEISPGIKDIDKVTTSISLIRTGTCK